MTEYTVDCIWTDPNANPTHDIAMAQEKLQSREAILYLHPDDFKHLHDYLSATDHDFSDGLFVHGVKIIIRQTRPRGQGLMIGNGLDHTELTMMGLS